MSTIDIAVFETDYMHEHGRIFIKIDGGMIQ